MEQNNILLFLESRTKTLGNGIALGMKSSIGWRELTFQGLGILAKRLGNYLIKNGIDKGDKIAIISESMPEWGAALFGSVLAGSITVPLDIKLTEFEMTSILKDCEPKILVVSNNFLEMGIKLKENIPSVEQIIILNDSSNRDFISLYNMPDEKEDCKWRHRAINKTALIIYTSGTTGKPKGVEISFKNALAQVESLGSCFSLGENDRFLSILPMNHLFELTVGFLTFLSKGSSIYYSQSLKPVDLFPIMKDKKITFMIVVPAFMRLLKNSIESEINKMSAIRKWSFQLRYAIAKFIPCRKCRQLMFHFVNKKFGGKFKGFISGGAPLDVAAAKFFQRLGIQVFEGYGLSETSPVVSINRQNDVRLGSVGKAIPGVEVKLDAQTNELLVKGNNVMTGYYNRPDLTKEIISEDGWLHTGDIAKIDKDGFIYITGRIKNMIVLSGGKKIFPEDLETIYEQSPKFAEVCVFGAIRKGGQKDGTEDIFVAVRPSDALTNSISDEKERENIIRKEIKELSLKISHYKRPKNILITNSPFPRTSTRKVKRKEVKALLLNE